MSATPSSPANLAGYIFCPSSGTTFYLRRLGFTDPTDQLAVDVVLKQGPVTHLQVAWFPAEFLDCVQTQMFADNTIPYLSENAVYAKLLQRFLAQPLEQQRLQDLQQGYQRCQERIKEYSEWEDSWLEGGRRGGVGVGS
jgi:hypothetical protein